MNFLNSIKTNTLTKIYFIALFSFFSIFIYSFPNIASGEALFWNNPQILFFIPLFLLPLLISLFNDDTQFLNIKLLIFFLFGISLITLIFVSIYRFPLDIDSIVSMHSINLIIKEGFQSNLVIDANSIIHSTYSLPLFSILGALLSLILNISYVESSKYLPFLMTVVTFLIYYTFITKVLDKKVASISLLMIVTFPLVISVSGTFNNVVLGHLFIVLGWWLLYKYYTTRSFEYSLIVLIIISSFLLSHHLSYAVFVLSILFLCFVIYSSSFYLDKKINFKKASIFNNLILFSIVGVLAYYTFVYLSPLVTFLGTFTHQLVLEGTTTPTSQWVTEVIIQRISYVIFLVFILILSISSMKKDFKAFVNNKYFLFLLMGAFLLTFSIIGTFLHFPFNWDRTAIFGWMLIIPGSISIIFYNLEKNNLIKYFAIFSILFLMIGNIYYLDLGVIDHRGNNEYQTSFKNWLSIQEFDSAEWYGEHTNMISVSGDETIRRAYLMNNPQMINNNYILNFKYNYAALNINLTKIKTLNIQFLVFREENLYRIKGFTRLSKDNPQEKVYTGLYDEIDGDDELNLIYNNKEVKIFNIL